MTHRPIVLLSLLAACARAATPPEPVATHVAPAAPARPTVLEVGAVRNPTPAAPAPTRPPSLRAAPVPATVRVRLVRVTSALGEDGAGHMVAATHPVAIDLESSEGWPGGALSTTVFVGAQHFHTLGYPTHNTLRVVVADERSLPRDGEVALQYGAPQGPRRFVAAALPEAP